MHLKQPGFTYSACAPFTKHRERIQKFGETGSIKHLKDIYLDKAYFPHDITYSDSKNLARRIISDKTLKKRAYEIARNREYEYY